VSDGFEKIAAGAVDLGEGDERAPQVVLATLAQLDAPISSLSSTIATRPGRRTPPPR
jgi:hypothetical protein